MARRQAVSCTKGSDSMSFANILWHRGTGYVRRGDLDIQEGETTDR